MRWTGECHDFRQLGHVTRVFRTSSADNYLLLLAHFTRQSCVDPAEIKRYLGVDDEYEDIC